MTLVWAPLARHDVKTISDYIAAHDRHAAARVARRLIDIGPTLEAEPGLGRPGRVEGTREFVVTGLPFIVVYRAKERAVQIVRVLHAARLWPKSF